MLCITQGLELFRYDSQGFQPAVRKQSECFSICNSARLVVQGWSCPAHAQGWRGQNDQNNDRDGRYPVE